MNLVKLKPSERLVQVEALLASDLSNRRIAMLLGVNEGTIRRDRQKLCLSSTERAELDNGKPAEPMLREHKRRRKHLAQLLGKRKKGENQSSKLSAQLSWFIFEWLLKQPLVQADAEMILSLADRELESAPIADYEPIHYNYVERVIEATRPHYEPEEPEMMWEMIEWLSRWLARWVWRLESDSAVRSQAMDLARSAVSRGFVRSE